MSENSTQLGTRRFLSFDRLVGRIDEPRFRLQLALAVLFAIFTGVFAHIVEDYLDRESIVRWDLEFSKWLHVHANGALTTFFKVVTYGGNVAFLAVLTVVVAAYLARRGRFDDAAVVAISAFGIEGVNAILKLLFHRSRPELAYVHLDTYSFPSGHATGSSAIYGVVLFILFRHAARRAQVAAAFGYVALVALIGFSRLYLEAHYLSDVLAGCSLGAAWACATLFVYDVRPPRDVLRLVPDAARRRLLAFSR